MCGYSWRVRLSIVVPTYNERTRLGELVEAVFQVFAAHGIDGELVIVDDGSPDGTGALADDLATRHRIRVVHRPGKLGLGTAVIDGFAAASGEILGVMDADLSHPPVRAAAPAGRARGRRAGRGRRGHGDRLALRPRRRRPQLAVDPARDVALRVPAGAADHAGAGRDVRLLPGAAPRRRRRQDRRRRLQDLPRAAGPRPRRVGRRSALRVQRSRRGREQDVLARGDRAICGSSAI